MKKFVVFFFFIVILLGVFLGIRTVVLNNEKEEKKIEETDSGEYIDRMNLAFIEADTLNPILTKNQQTANILKLIYEPLIDINAKNKLEPALATEWMEKDEYTWVIKLRNDVLWHSEKKFTADDVIFTIDTLKAQDTSIYNSNVNNITNYEKIDENSISITIIERDEMFPYKLTFPIIPRYYWIDDIDNVEKANRPIGTGTYKFHSLDSDTKLMKIVSNDKWWKHVDFKLGTIFLYRYGSYGEAIKAFKSGEIDVISTTMSTWDKKFGVIGINSYSYESEKFVTLIPNTSRTMLSDNSVRRAILSAINRENIILNIYTNNASVADIPVHNYSWLYEKDSNSTYDFEKAKQLLVNAGWKQGSNKLWTKQINGKTYTIKFDLIVNKDNEENCKVADMISSDLKNLGINVTVRRISWETYVDNINKGNFDLALGVIDLYSDLDVAKLIQPDGTLNYAKYKNENLQNGLQGIKLSNTLLEENFKKFQADYKNEAPYIGLYFKSNTVLTNKSVKGDINPTWWNPYNNIWTWTK